MAFYHAAWLGLTASSCSTLAPHRASDSQMAFRPSATSVERGIPASRASQTLKGHRKRQVSWA